jgi:hypothetical protein
MWDKVAAVEYLDANARSHSVSRCAEFVRLAIEAGGLQLVRRQSAKDYGSSLEIAGFGVIDPSFPALGDIVVIQPVTGQRHGHMAMYNGANWVSDFKQMHGLYPGLTYRRLKPDFSIYRYRF